MVLVGVVLVAVAGSAVYRLNGIFGSHDVTSTPARQRSAQLAFGNTRES
ncbi:MmpS family transport accessory protein [Mycobacterium sp.]